MNKLQEIVNKKWFVFLFFGVLAIVGVCQHYRVFSLDIIGYHSWRQTQTQTVIDNFAGEDLCILNPRLDNLLYPDRLYRMEFPLMQWLVALLVKLTGRHVIITRLFCFLITIISTLGMYRLVKVLTGHRIVSYATAWLFFFSPLIYYYSVNPLPDNLALCFSVWAMYYWFKYLSNPYTGYFVASCALLALSAAVKLPFIIFGGMYLSKARDHKRLNPFYLAVPFTILLPVMAWYAWVIGTWRRNDVLQGITGRHMGVADFFDILQHNLISTLPELLVNYATLPLFLAGFFLALKALNFRRPVHVSLLCISALSVLYFFYEMNMIAKVHDYYLFPFLPLIFLLVAKCLQVVSRRQAPALKYIAVLSFLLCPITAYLRCNTRWNTYSPGFPKEYLLDKTQLKKLIAPRERIIVDGDASGSIVLYHLQRKGWSFDPYEMSAARFREALQQQAHYLVFDCRADTLNFVKPYLDTLLFSKGDVKLYKLKHL